MGKLLALLAGGVGFSAVSLLALALVAAADATSAPAARGPVAVPVPVPTIAPSVTLSAAEQRLVDAVNRYRGQRGLRPVSVHPDLEQAARLRTGWYHDHGLRTSHVAAGRLPWADARRCGFRGRGVGENTAQGYETPEVAVFGGWHSSRGHQRNMVDRDWRYIGVGAVGTTYVTVFGF